MSGDTTVLIGHNGIQVTLQIPGQQTTTTLTMEPRMATWIARQIDLVVSQIKAYDDEIASEM